MQQIEMQEASEAFAHCWQAAGHHIQTTAQGAIRGWLRAHLNAPFLEHLSFPLGNQLFFIRIEDADGKLEVPGSRAGLMSIASGCNGYACLMPMHRQGQSWHPVIPGWGLVGARDEVVIDPPALVTDEAIEMTDWELQDFAVQVVRDHLLQSGRQLMSWQGNPSADPSIWFVGEQRPEWVVVRAVRYPALSADLPANWQSIQKRCAKLSSVGHFASVVVASSEDAFDRTGNTPPEPLWRGHEMIVKFDGLIEASRLNSRKIS